MQETVFGYKRGMTVAEINAASKSNLKPRNQYSKKCFTVFPAQLDIDLFNEYTATLNDSGQLEQLNFILDKVFYKDLAQQFYAIKQALEQKYGILSSATTSHRLFQITDPYNWLDEFFEMEGDFNFSWGGDISPDCSHLIQDIKMSVKKDSDNQGFFNVEVKLKDIQGSTEPTQENLELEDLLDDSESPIYKNDSAYDTIDNPQTSHQELVTERQTQETISQIDVADIQPDTSRNFSEETQSERKSDSLHIMQEISPCHGLKVNMLSVLGIIFIGIVWICMLKNPITAIYVDSTLTLSSIIFSTVYYILYFSYTVTACILPLFIIKKINKFIQSEEKEKQTLFTNEDTGYQEHKIWKTYKSTFFDKNFGIQNKTRANADLYFNFETVSNVMFSKFPAVSTFKLISGSFMGMGILGTFLGFSTGFQDIQFSSEDPVSMLQSIESLVQSGLSTAFNTSIVGVFSSIIYSFLIYNPLLKEITSYFENLSDELDKEFYLSETEALMQYTMLTDENEQSITFNQSLRFIVENMNKQTDALNNFNDNLADKIANIHDKVDSSLGQFTTGIGTEVKAAVLDNVHREMDGLKITLVEAAQKLEVVVDKIEATPQLLEQANLELKGYLEDTRTSFTAMLSQNLETNKIALDEVVSIIREELSHQFADFRTSLVTALDSSKEITILLNEISNRIKLVNEYFLKQGKNIATHFETTSKQISTISTALESYLKAAQEGVSTLFRDLAATEENIRELLVSAKTNEATTQKNLTVVISETNKILEGFKNVDRTLASIFSSIGEEIQKYNSTVGSTLDQYLSSFEKGASSFSGSMSGTISEFGDSIEVFTAHMNRIQETSETFTNSINELGKVLTQATKDKV